jgi:hypothetical protein
MTRFPALAVRRLSRAGGAAVLLALAGCGGDSWFAKPPPPKPCPQVAQVDDAAELTRYSGSGRDLTDVAFEAQLGGMAGSCAYDDNEIDVELSVQFIASRGPADQTRRADFTYFVAIAKVDQTVLAREEFDSFIEFPGNQTRAGIVEELTQRIPIGPDDRGDSFIIYVGFKLTPEELEFNRAQQ